MSGIDHEYHQQRKVAWDAYDREHAVCPVCRGDNVCTTTMGILWLPGQAIKDTNRATCICGWKGIRHDMIAHPTNPEKTT